MRALLRRGGFATPGSSVGVRPPTTHSMMTRTLSAAPQLPFKKLLACNRGEIAVRIMRAASELGIRTCGIFSHEDRLTAHRYKADESFLVGEGLSPVGAYLHVEEIVDLMLRQAREIRSYHRTST